VIYVNAYERDQRYGGPEEGGWWYSAYTLVGTELRTPSMDAANSWCRHLRATRTGGGREVWHVPDVPDLDDANYDHLVSVSHEDLVYRVEDHPGVDHDDYPEGGWA